MRKRRRTEREMVNKVLELGVLERGGRMEGSARQCGRDVEGRAIVFAVLAGKCYNLVVMYVAGAAITSKQWSSHPGPTCSQ